MDISIAKARASLSHLVNKAKIQPVVISRRGKAVGVLVSPEEWEQLSRVRAYLDMLRLSQALSATGTTAAELHRASREELEARE